MSILSGIGKTFKSITGSPSKVLLASAAVYLGGSAFGWWESPFESINGVWKTDDVGATSASAGGEVSSLAADARAPAESAGSGSTEMIDLMGTRGAHDFMNPSDGAAAAMSATKVPATDPFEVDGSQEAYGGTAMTSNLRSPDSIISKVRSKASGFLGETGEWIKKNPVPAMMLGNAAANAFQPNAIDVLRERAKIEREEGDRRRQIANSNQQVGSVSLGPLDRRGGIVSAVRRA